MHGFFPSEKGRTKVIGLKASAGFFSNLTAHPSLPLNYDSAHLKLIYVLDRVNFVFQVICVFYINEITH